MDSEARSQASQIHTLFSLWGCLLLVSPVSSVATHHVMPLISNDSVMSSPIHFQFGTCVNTTSTRHFRISDLWVPAHNADKIFKLLHCEHLK